MPSITAPTRLDQLAAELADTIRDRPGWHAADGSLRADHMHDGWHAVVLTTGHGWQYTVWCGVRPLRRLDQQAATTAAEALDLAEKVMGRD